MHNSQAYNVNGRNRILQKMDGDHTKLINWSIIIITSGNEGSTRRPAKVSPTMILFQRNQQI
jgi:hypothetical protein